MVLIPRIELGTSSLPRMRSTTELQQHTIPKGPQAAGRPGRGALLAAPPCFVKPKPDSPHKLPMREDHPPQSPPASREERLAAKLRENLRRRKQQARELADPALPKDESSG